MACLHSRDNNINITVDVTDYGQGTLSRRKNHLSRTIAFVSVRRSIVDFFYIIPVHYEARGSSVVKALCYKPERRGFETQ
jgi:hypothetical protein